MSSARACWLIAVVLSLVAVPMADAATIGLDATFGEGGIARVPFTMRSALESRPIAPVRQPDGKVLVAAAKFQDHGTTAILLARFTRSGRPDPTFGHGGREQVGQRWNFAPYAVHVRPDGRILVLGAAGYGRRSLYPTPGQFGLVRLLPDGSRDRTFGTNGLVAWNSPWRADTQNLVSLPGVFVQQGGGRVLGAGIVEELRWLGDPFASPSVESRRVVFVRFNEDGSVDESFGRAGVIEGPEGPDFFDGFAALSDGRVVALSSRTEEAGSASLWLHRFTADGVVDSAFGSDGSVRLDLKDPYDVRGLVPAPDGGLVILRKRALRRIRPSGKLDARFGTACGRPRVPAFSYGGAATTSGGGVLATGTTYVIRGRQDSVFVGYGSDGCVASRPLRLRARYYSGPPTLQGRHRALVGASFDNGLALIRIRR